MSPLAMTAKSLMDATWNDGPAYDLASQAAFALESAQLLQSPETAAEHERLRARVAELEATIAAVEDARHPEMGEGYDEALDRVGDVLNSAAKAGDAR